MDLPLTYPRIPVAGVNLLVGTENGLMLLDRSGQGKVYGLIGRRRFQQMDVLEGLNLLITISGVCMEFGDKGLNCLRIFILGGEQPRSDSSVGSRNWAFDKNECLGLVRWLSG